MAEKNTKPWLEGVQGDQVPQIIECDADIIVVEAGPGTGKTFGLTRRVQRILHPDGLNVPGKRVLVVAFNRAIAKQLKKDIGDCLEQSPHEGEPVIRTIHALCLEILREKFRILLPHEIEAMLYDILCEYTDLKMSYKIHARAQQAFHNHVAELEDHRLLWKAVRQWLIRHDAQLISDLPHLLLGRLQGGDFANNTYLHVIVDEFQDLTPGEQQLFFELKGPEGKLVVLGDPRQSIYAFRGNDPEGLDKIKSLPLSSEAVFERISMTECHRCPKEVVHAANVLMGLYEIQPMEPRSKIEANTHVVVWESTDAEATGMARAIVDNIQEYPNQHHLAMVTRREFGALLREKISALNPNLNIDLSFSESLLQTWAVREAFLFFCLLVDPDAPTWRAWFGYQNSDNGRKFKAPSRNAAAYLNFLSECDDNITLETVRQLVHAPRQPAGKGGKKLRERAKRLLDLMTRFQWDAEDGIRLLNEVFNPDEWNASESPDPVTATLDMKEILLKACDIYEELDQEHSDLTVKQKLAEIAVQLRYQIATREPLVPSEQSDLRIATLWGAKGATAHHVYVIGLCNEAIPGLPHDGYPGTKLKFFQEQQRLFYVSITRSKETLVLSRSESIPHGDAARLGFAQDKEFRYKRKLNMCNFLQEIRDCLPRSQKGEDWAGCV